MTGTELALVVLGLAVVAAIISYRVRHPRRLVRRDGRHAAPVESWRDVTRMYLHRAERGNHRG